MEVIQRLNIRKPVKAALILWEDRDASGRPVFAANTPFRGEAWVPPTGAFVRSQADAIENARQDLAYDPTG